MPETQQREPEQPPEITRSPVTAFTIGLAAGAGSGLLGVGGGLMMVPGMVLMLRVRQHRAVGTSLAVIFPTAIIAAICYHQQALGRDKPGLDLWAILWLAVGGVAGARLGALLAHRLHARQLRRTFGVFVMLAAVGMIFRAFTSLPGGNPNALDPAHALLMVGVGVVVGIVSGLLGVGGGLVMVPALVLLLHYDQHLAQGTSLAVIIPVSVSASLVHMLVGNVIWSLAWPMALGAVLGTYWTANAVFGIPEQTLKLIFGLFLLCMGAGMAARRPRPASTDDPPPSD